MSSAAGLSDLLLEWDELRRLGQARSAAELCGDRSELVAPLEERIRALESMERRLGVHQDEAPALAAWPVIPGHELLAVIDQGGMGIIYRARHVRLKRLVALKMTLGVRAGPQQLARFRTEAEAVARLQHPNIVQIYDVGESDGRPFFTMELVEGGSLAQHLAGKPLPPTEAARLVETLARAIHYAHERGIVHRDLKPANILLMRHAERGMRNAE
jgi:serine/threonine-protein kinase